MIASPCPLGNPPQRQDLSTFSRGIRETALPFARSTKPPKLRAAMASGLARIQPSGIISPSAVKISHISESAELEHLLDFKETSLSLEMSDASMEMSKDLAEHSGSVQSAVPIEEWPDGAVPRSVTAKTMHRYQADADEPPMQKMPSGVAVVDRRGGSGSNLSLFDTTGDGKPNLVGIDTTGDGNVDTIAVDSTRDGRIDSISSAGVDVETIQLVDESGDGLVDTVKIDPSRSRSKSRTFTTGAVVVASRTEASASEEHDLQALRSSDALATEVAIFGAVRGAAPGAPQQSSSASCSAAGSSSEAVATPRVAVAFDRRSNAPPPPRSSAQAGTAPPAPRPVARLEEATAPAAAAAPAQPAQAAASSRTSEVAAATSDGRHCSRCAELTLVAAAFGGRCYYCHAFPTALTWHALTTSYALTARWAHLAQVPMVT